MIADANLEQLQGELRIILLAIAMTLAVSVGVFWALIARWTSRRRWVALSDWAHVNGFRLHRPDQIKLTPALRNASPTMQGVLSLTCGGTTLLQADSSQRRWNVLVRETATPWPLTALRPVAQQPSICDLFAMESFPALGAGERFLVCGQDKPSARILARSSIRGLLPRDIGLLLHGRELVLDFSSRPFDEIEFGRMMALADQLAANLPSLSPQQTT